MELDKCVKNLLIKEPFYGLFMLNLNRYYSDRVPTAGVRLNGINFELAVNKDFFEKLPDNEALSILKHEVTHIIYKHPLYGPEYSNHERFNQAADLEVNSAIQELQKDPYLYPALFNFDLFKGTKWYYENLPANLNTSTELVDDHSNWEESDNISDSEKQLISNQVDFIAKNTAEQVIKTCGSIPGQFKDYIDSLFKIKEQVFNWKAYFRRVIGNLITSELKLTRMRPSRRFPDGRGIRFIRKPHILVGIDTSGSVSIDELKDFFSEIYHLWKSGVKITIDECDTEITNTWEYNGKIATEITGRGGTDINPIIDHYNSNRKEFSTLVIFTDGEFYLNSLHKTRDVVWVISSAGQHQNFPGTTIYIPNI